jgi:hypothetical protein
LFAFEPLGCYVVSRQGSFFGALQIRAPRFGAIGCHHPGLGRIRNKEQLMKRIILAFAISACLCSTAQALQLINGHVTLLESTYLPNEITFQLDSGIPACPTGTWLHWKKTGTIDQTYASLLSALLAGKKVNFFINDNDATCVGQFFHITDSF